MLEPHHSKVLELLQVPSADSLRQASGTPGLASTHQPSGLADAAYAAAASSSLEDRLAAALSAAGYCMQVRKVDGRWQVGGAADNTNTVATSFRGGSLQMQCFTPGSSGWGTTSSSSSGMVKLWRQLAPAVARMLVSVAQLTA
jgi:hypothetical protein